MIKKTIGIATLLLLILGIAIGIAKADTKTAKSQKHVRHDVASKTGKDLNLLLSEQKALKLQEKLVEPDLSSAVKNLVKPDVLLDAKLTQKQVDTVELNGDLRSLVPEEPTLTDSWNKNDLVHV